MYVLREEVIVEAMLIGLAIGSGPGRSGRAEPGGPGKPGNVI